MELYSSAVRIFFNSSLDESGTTPQEASTKHSGGYKMHHQFFPDALPRVTLKAVYSPEGSVISPYDLTGKTVLSIQHAAV